MLGKWLNRPKDTNPTFRGLEKSVALDETYKLAHNAKGDPYFDKSLREHLEERYCASDRESYDCHSFMASIAKHELGANVVTAPEFNRPKRDDFDSESEWLYELQKSAEQMFKMPEGRPYVASQRNLTMNIYRNSDHIPIPHIPPRDDRSSERRTTLAKHITQEVIKEISRKGASRILLFSSNEAGHFRDVHSSIVLGIGPDGKDVLLLEKFQIGDPIHIRKLSDIIESQMLSYSENLTLNILRKPIGRMSQPQ